MRPICERGQSISHLKEDVRDVREERAIGWCFGAWKMSVSVGISLGLVDG